ncbi:MAG TPA: hypothetical protein DIC42_04425 [Holosporales bacterium]|nr:hypothetical protein [Holosporales bacterium]
MTMSNIKLYFVNVGKMTSKFLSLFIIICTTVSCLGIENDGHQAYIEHMETMRLIAESLQKGEVPPSALGELIIPAGLTMSLPTFTVKPDEDGKIDHNWIVSYSMNRRTLRTVISDTEYCTLHIFKGLNSIIYRWCPVT